MTAVLVLLLTVIHVTFFCCTEVEGRDAESELLLKPVELVVLLDEDVLKLKISDLVNS